MSRSSKQGAPRVALVGRPNVGKSTLFNRLIGRREAIVHDRPGVTRDRLERGCRFIHRAVILEDTGGLVPAEQDALIAEITRQAMEAIASADVIVFVIDGRAGPTPLDHQIAELLRPHGVPIVLAANKLDTVELESSSADAWGLKVGEPSPVSAEHGLGIDELLDRIESSLPPGEDGDDPLHAPAADPDVELHLAIVGRPNVGKSSIVNRLAGVDRVTVSSEPGTTRDAIDVTISRDGQRVRLVDTAGLRRRGKTQHPDELVGMMIARRRISRCHVAVLVTDATMGITSQDVAVAGEIAKAGRPLVVAFNKWDAVNDLENAYKKLRQDLERRMPFAAWAESISISAKSGQRVFKLVDVARRVAGAAQRRIKTADLNRFLEQTMARHQAAGTALPKTFYMTQTGSLPPRFVLFHRSNGPVPETFRRFLSSRLREAFDLGPTPVLIEFRRSKRGKDDSDR